MRLLFLTAETWPTFRADVAALFGKYLPRHGVYSDLVTGRARGQREPAPWGGGETFLFEVRGGQARKHVHTLLHGIRHLLRADRTRYDAIQVRDMPVLAAIALVVARAKRLPFFYWMSYPMPQGQIELAHERGLSAGLMKFLFPWVSGRVGHFLLYRFVLHRADHVFVQSERMKADMAALAIPFGRMTPVPMGVDHESTRPDEIEPVSDARLKGRRVLVYLGTLDRPRRIESLFEVLLSIKRSLPDVLLVLAGDTEDAVHRQWLQAEAVRLGVAADVVWTGWLPMRDGWAYLRAADVAFSYIPRGSLLDCASPTKVPEYLALGVAVVCNDNPDQAQVVRESGAGICVPYSAEAFAEATVTLLNRTEQERAQAREAGVAYVRTHRSYDVISRNVAEAYRRVV